MKRRLRLAPRPTIFAFLVSAFLVAFSGIEWRPEAAQPLLSRSRTREGSGPDTLPNDPQVIETERHRVRVTAVKGLDRPWALAFLPNGDMLVTERPGRLRLVRRDLTLDPRPITGIPTVLASAYKGLMDVALHPDFAANRLVYFTYTKVMPGESLEKDFDLLTGPAGTVVLARGRFDGDHGLTDVKDLFVADAATSGVSAARFAFGRDGRIYLGIGAPNRHLSRGGTNRVGTSEEAQDPARHSGKILRLNDDGSVPPDNPFVGRTGYRPETFAMGLRNPLGLIVHPQTGDIWAADHGPLGGDEVDIIRPGRNYGWPVVSYGRAYNGELTQGGFGPELAEPCAPGMEPPFLFWNPNIAPGGMVIYTGDRFPAWKGHLLLGGLRSTQLHRVSMTAAGLPGAREAMLTSLRQRIREVRQGPDGLLYLLTDHEAGALLRVEPAPAP